MSTYETSHGSTDSSDSSCRRKAGEGAAVWGMVYLSHANMVNRDVSFKDVFEDDTLRDICGPDPWRRIAFGVTHRGGNDNLSETKLWEPLVENGAQTALLDDSEPSALHLLSLLCNRMGQMEQESGGMGQPVSTAGNVEQSLLKQFIKAVAGVVFYLLDLVGLRRTSTKGTDPESQISPSDPALSHSNLDTKHTTNGVLFTNNQPSPLPSNTPTPTHRDSPTSQNARQKGHRAVPLAGTTVLNGKPQGHREKPNPRASERIVAPDTSGESIKGSVRLNCLYTNKY